jgi:hypothetical protein
MFFKDYNIAIRICTPPAVVIIGSLKNANLHTSLVFVEDIWSQYYDTWKISIQFGSGEAQMLIRRPA